MHDLRFTGVDDAANHLLLSDDDGNRFRLALDDRLRAAVRRDAPGASVTPIHQRPAPTSDEAGLRPRDVQAMIRAGHSAEVVAERAGWSVEKVHRYEGPILGERAYVAGLARQVRLRPRAGAHAAGATLEDRVAERMQTREIEPSTATWDSFRTPTGLWSVLVFFNAGGRERQARWEFDPLARTVSAGDDEARWLSQDEDDAAPGPLAAPHLQNPPRPSRVYDVEAEGGLEAPQRRRRSEPVDLMSTMRERSSQRGRRRRSTASDVPGIDRVPEEALPLENLAMTPEQAGEPPAAHPQAERASDDVFAEPVADDGVDHSDEVTQAPNAGRSKPVGLVDEPLPLEIGQADRAQAAAQQDAVTDADDADDTDDTDDAADVADVAEHDTTDGVGSDDVGPSEDSRASDTGRAADTVEPAAEAEETDGSSDAVERSDSSAAPDEAAAVALTAEEAKPTSPPARRPASRKSGRPSVPSWDDIMFGKKSP